MSKIMKHEMVNLDPILLLTTGGSIDSFYDDRKKDAVPYRFSGLPDLLESAEWDSSFVHRPICMKDSSDITSHDRERMWQEIYGGDFRRVIITHGTNTLDQTACYLLSRVQEVIPSGRLARTVVLTGSSHILGINPEHVATNLGYCMGVARLLPSGIYVHSAGVIERATLPGGSQLPGDFQLSEE